MPSEIQGDLLSFRYLDRLRYSDVLEQDDLIAVLGSLQRGRQGFITCAADPCYI